MGFWLLTGSRVVTAAAGDGADAVAPFFVGVDPTYGAPPSFAIALASSASIVPFGCTAVKFM